MVAVDVAVVVAVDDNDAAAEVVAEPDVEVAADEWLTFALVVVVAVAVALVALADSGSAVEEAEPNIESEMKQLFNYIL